ncbi:hypothetical protein T4B_954 [Trichinella pseudospiralis]|uniref:Uncharacterized protein n=1 Tax=Trichinella pseudospiralis TaxID=6337 RepID=A0A0V1JV24_TRIPS|nr:hypothetical protein T4B_954 [Trichinella pseudospiralis]KRZ38817.1 hypothetical protein T4C_5749 [Trichinella pseudospiralis]
MKRSNSFAQMVGFVQRFQRNAKEMLAFVAFIYNIRAQCRQISVTASKSVKREMAVYDDSNGSAPLLHLFLDPLWQLNAFTEPNDLVVN